MRFAKQILLGVGLFGILSVSLTGCGRSIAKVNGEKISKQEYLDRLEAMPITVGDRARPAGAVVIEQLIQEKLRMEMARQEGVAPTDEEIDKRVDRMKRDDSYKSLKGQGNTDEQIRQTVRLQLAIFSLMTKGIKVTDKEVENYYNANKGKYPFTSLAGTEFGAIITKKEETIKEASRLIHQKKQQFGTVAMRFGDIPALRQSQGRIGILPANINLLPADKRPSKVITDTIAGLKDGQVSNPVWGGDGWYIVKVFQRRKGEMKKLPQVREQIRETLLMQKAQLKYDPRTAGKKVTSPNDRFKKFFTESKVKINVRRHAGLWKDMQKQAKEEAEMQAVPVEPPKASTGQ